MGVMQPQEYLGPQHQNPTDFKNPLHDPNDTNPNSYHVTICSDGGQNEWKIPGGAVPPANGTVSYPDPAPAAGHSRPALGTTMGTDGAVNITGHVPGDSTLDVTVKDSNPDPTKATRHFRLQVHVIDCAHVRAGQRGRVAVLGAGGAGIGGTDAHHGGTVGRDVLKR